MTTQERIANNIAQFQKGMFVNALIDNDVEIEGTIESIDGNYAQVKTKHGIFKVWLALAKKLD